MSFIGDIFHGIGNLFSGSSSQPQQAAPQTTITMPKPAAPQQQAPQKPGTTGGQDPTFLASAALPNYGAAVGAQSNPGGKSLLGQ